MKPRDKTLQRISYKTFLEYDAKQIINQINISWDKSYNFFYCNFEQYFVTVMQDFITNVRPGVDLIKLFWRKFTYSLL